MCAPLMACGGGITQGAADPGIGPDAVLPPEARAIVAAAKARQAGPPRVDGPAPDVFQLTETVTWDGKPTFGAVWVSVPAAEQPERVEIRNEATGVVVKGAMLIAPAGDPIRLSAGAAKELGIAPSEPVSVTITALRMSGAESAAVAVPVADPAPDLAQVAPRFGGAVPPGLPPIVAAEPPSLNPAPIDGGFVEVAQAVSPDGALRVQTGLAAAAIPAEIQQDLIDGASVFRVFASTETDAEVLFSALDNIRYATGEEGSDDGTLIAEIPNFRATREVPPQWVELGSFGSRNEAMAMVQRLSRTAVPTEVCRDQRGLLTVFRVFGGPSDAPPTVPDLAAQLNAAFCAGVSASADAPPAPQPARSAPAEPTPSPSNTSDGPVRIKVGEATGGLNLSVPLPFSAPVLVPVGNVMVAIPPDASVDLVEQIREALAPLR